MKNRDSKRRLARTDVGKVWDHNEDAFLVLEQANKSSDGLKKVRGSKFSRSGHIFLVSMASMVAKLEKLLVRLPFETVRILCSA